MVLWGGDLCHGRVWVRCQMFVQDVVWHTKKPLCGHLQQHAIFHSEYISYELQLAQVSRGGK